ncbi:uracil-DNA glycosylase [Kwoniella bestiolae CBS 10118]|uniref:Uracil-DNA glycosylase n=1 Tax=Kwoniella bestiolae CBS 10118 TaxID=1296100 RepID=A0A1B9GGE0_9TREE|nr:uracil-DNA glycosylase [Kwoniella bestiolae CBS 10118]OCF30124.1 uracil-DNA glycosylase [Kwoniella bestiolae CBS 10118]
MPPQAKSIASYFKPTTTVVAATTTASASPITTPDRKKSTLSEAAKRAIQEGAQAAANDAKENDELGEPSAKKQRLDVGSSPSGAKVADIFLKPSPSKLSSSSGTLPIVRSKTREELRERISAKPDWANKLKLEVDTMGEDWLMALQDELTKSYFLNLKEFVTTEQKTKKVFPPAEDIYSWSRFCPLKDIRVVIIGQDPYHDDGQAHGLAFSVRKGVRIPPSLRNMYKEMHDEIPEFVIPKHGDLTEWAKHGVLLLNTSLTVRAHEAGSHANKGWDTFTAAVLKVVTSRLAPGPSTISSTDKVPGAKGVVFMAWGAHAAKMCAGVDKTKHLILKSAHPSPLSASRGFFGNNHFKKANEWLELKYGPEGGIDWKALGAGEGGSS